MSETNKHEPEAVKFHSPNIPHVGMLTPTAVGSMNYNIVATILRDGRVLRLNRGAEIGVLNADTSDYLLKNFPELKLFCVDPYLEYEQFEPNRTQSAMSKYEINARRKLAQYGERAELIKDFSTVAANKIENGSLDFAFIDALHTYEAVKEDMQAWYPKLRSQGMLMGHDISWEGVKQAVEEFSLAMGVHVYHTPSTSDVWFLVKP